MPADLTSTGLLAAIRRNASLGQPNANAFPADTDLLAWTNEEMTNACVTVLMKPREEFFVEHYDFTTSTAENRIPAASFASDVRDVQALLSGSTTEYVSLPRVEPEFAAAYNQNDASSPWPVGYYLRGNYVVIVPTPAGASIRLKYFRRPGNIVTSSYYSLVTGLSGSAPTYTATLTSASAFTAVTSFEFCAKLAPFDTVLTGIAGVYASATTLTLTMTAAQAALITARLSALYGLADGDAPGPQIPQDLVPYLEQRATWRALVAKNDPGGAKAQFSQCEITRDALVNAMNARTQGLGRKVVGRNFANRGYGNLGGWWGGTS